MEEKARKKRRKRRSIDSRLMREKCPLSLRAISEATIDSAEIMAMIMKERFLK